MSLSPFPVANFARELKYLLGYPHGCLEQISKAFPQIYLRDIAAILAPVLNTRKSNILRERGDHHESHADSDGTFTYWPVGVLQRLDHGVCHAFPARGEESGVCGNGRLMKPPWRRSHVSPGTERPRTIRAREAKGTVHRIAAKSVHLRALRACPCRKAGAADDELLPQRKYLLTLDTRYLLAGAFALSGDRRTYSDLLPSQFGG